MGRWLNPTIRVYYDVTNAPADAADRLNGTLTTLNAEYPGLDLISGGATNFTPDCSDNSVAGLDFVNFSNALNGIQTIIVFFEDPCNELLDLAACAGTYGIGGGYTLSNTHTYKSDTWFNAAWGYAVVNNGARACLDATEYEQVAHPRADPLPAHGSLADLPYRQYVYHVLQCH